MLRLAYSYGCLMAPIGEPLSGEIRAWGETIPDDLIFEDDKGEMGREKETHVTVKYGLHTSDPDEVMEKVSGWPPFTMTLGRTSVFHGEGDFVVLKVGIRGSDIRLLNKHICREFEFTDKYPVYRPHATIAYMVRNPEDPYYYREYFTDQFDGKTVQVNELEFSPAEGEHVMIPLKGTDDGLVAMQLLGMARDVMEV